MQMLTKVYILMYSLITNVRDFFAELVRTQAFIQFYFIELELTCGL